MDISTRQRLADVARSRIIAFPYDVVGIVGARALILGDTFNDMFDTLGSRIQSSMK